MEEHSVTDDESLDIYLENTSERIVTNNFSCRFRFHTPKIVEAAAF